MSRERRGVRIRWWKSAEAKAVNRLNRVRWVRPSGEPGPGVDTTTSKKERKEQDND